MSSRIAVVEDIWGADFDELAEHHTIAYEPNAWQDRARILELAATSDVLVVRNRTQVDEQLLSETNRLRVVARAGVGLDNIDLNAANTRGMIVLSPLGANARSVAEHALGLALSLARQIPALDRDVRAGGWKRKPGIELAGGTWGLVSAGSTARATGELASAVGMKVIAYDPYIPVDHPDLERLGIELHSLEEVFSQSDVVSVHLPNTPETAGLIGAELLGLLRESAILINVGRGEVIDEQALAKALREAKFRGVGLDVRASEPSQLGDEFFSLENAVLTPHVAGITSASQLRINRALVSDIRRILGGESALNAVSETRRILSDSC